MERRYIKKKGILQFLFFNFVFWILSLHFTMFFYVLHFLRDALRDVKFFFFFFFCIHHGIKKVFVTVNLTILTFLPQLHLYISQFKPFFLRITSLLYLKAAVHNFFVFKVYKIDIISEYTMNPFSKPCFLLVLNHYGTPIISVYIQTILD